MSAWTELDTGAYEILHQQLLHQPTRREQRLQNRSGHSENSLCRRQRHENKNQILIHHTFESGPLLNFKSQYRQLWNQSYVTSGTRIGKPRLIIGSTNNPCLQNLFVWKKPSRTMLTKLESQEDMATSTTNR